MILHTTNQGCKLSTHRHQGSVAQLHHRDRSTPIYRQVPENCETHELCLEACSGFFVAASPLVVSVLPQQCSHDNGCRCTCAQTLQASETVVSQVSRVIRQDANHNNGFAVAGTTHIHWCAGAICCDNSYITTITHCKRPQPTRFSFHTSSWGGV